MLFNTFIINLPTYVWDLSRLPLTPTPMCYWCSTVSNHWIINYILNLKETHDMLGQESWRCNEWPVMYSIQYNCRFPGNNGLLWSTRGGGVKGRDTQSGSRDEASSWHCTTQTMPPFHMQVMERLLGSNNPSECLKWVGVERLELIISWDHWVPINLRQSVT